MQLERRGYGYVQALRGHKQALLTLAAAASLVLGGCSSVGNDPQLTQNTVLVMVDWHITGLWIINCPVAWVRVTNNNAVPIKDITFQYNTYNFEGKPLDEGTFTIEDEVPPGTTKNFIELYLGMVDLHSDKLSVKLLSVAGS